MKKVLLAAVLTAALSGCGSSISGDPLPLNEQGAARLNEASRSVDVYGMMRQAQSDPEKLLQAGVQAYSEMFAKAGYSLEATLVDVDQGLNHGSEEDREAYVAISHSGIPMIFNIVSQLNGAAKKADVDLEDYMHEDAADAVRSIAEKL